MGYFLCKNEIGLGLVRAVAQRVDTILPKDTFCKVCETMKNGSGPSIFVPVHIADSVNDNVDVQVRLVLVDGIDGLKLSA